MRPNSTQGEQHQRGRCIILEASGPLDPSRFIALCALVIIHMLQADMLQADTRATPCSQPLQQRAYATAAP